MTRQQFLDFVAEVANQADGIDIKAAKTIAADPECGGALFHYLINPSPAAADQFAAAVDELARARSIQAGGKLKPLFEEG